MLDAFFTQERLSVFDRQAFVVQQVLNAAQKQHVGGAIIAPPPCAFDRLYLREFAFPEPQYMGRDIQPFCDFADGAKGVRRLGHWDDPLFTVAHRIGANGCGPADGGQD